MKAKRPAVYMKVSEKGAIEPPLKESLSGSVSLYGLGRFPVTLYQEQWLKVLGMADEIKAFIEENHGRLKVKE